MDVMQLIKNCLLKIIDEIDAGRSKISDDSLAEVLEMVSRLSHAETKYSKYQACKYLDISRATFDNWVRDGKIPKGRSQQGFKEKFWLKQDLDLVKKI